MSNNLSEEEIIKIIKEYLSKIYTECTKVGAVGIPNEEWYAIQGLLNLYQQEKELHKEYEDKFFKLLSSFDRLKELAETLRKENVELLIEKKQKELKVREKIKELEKSYEDSYAINILKELLEEE